MKNTRGIIGYMASCVVCGRVRRARGVCRDCRASVRAEADEVARERALLAQDEGLVDDLELLSGRRTAGG